VRSAIRRAVDVLAERGLELIPATPDEFDFTHAWELFGEICMSERIATDAQRRQQRLEYLESQRGNSTPIIEGMRRGATTDLPGYLRCVLQRAELTTSLEKFLSSFDAFVCPAMATVAFPHCAPGTPIEIDGVPVDYEMANAAYTSPFSLTGHPAVVLPIPQARSALPVGMQLVGRRWHDLALLSTAKAIATALGPLQWPTAQHPPINAP